MHVHLPIKKRHIFSAAAFVLILLVFTMGYLGYHKVFSAGSLPYKHVVIIPKGTSTKDISEKLYEEGVIDSPVLFHVLSRIVHKPLQAGEYAFYPWMSLWDIITILNEGRVVVHRFTVPEGLSSFEVVTYLEQTESLTGSLIEIPDEGTLFPNTYHFHYGETRQGMIDRMKRAMQERLKELWDARDADLPLKTVEEALILASIVEKETIYSSESKQVAGVFYNRLKKGMPLQSDPTVTYGITKGRKVLGRSLTKEDLKTGSSHNTYVLKALPPTPICNPGYTALNAVLHPAKTQALFFVADGTGKHVFSTTYTEHAKHHANWRTIRRQLNGTSTRN